MLEEMHTEIDAVTISTPDHTHAPAGLMAMSLGKHVYCQKPLTHSVYEARRMGQAARQYNVTTQMGNQGTASDGLRKGVEVIQSGAIGPVREVHVWTNRPVWPQAPSITARPPEAMAVPNHVDWYLFLGPAPDRPYHNAYHPFKWRGWWDFGTGAIGDMSCHTANLAFMALKLGHPLSIEALDHGPINQETFPAWATTRTEFGARGIMPPVSYFCMRANSPMERKTCRPWICSTEKSLPTVVPSWSVTRGFSIPPTITVLIGSFSPGQFQGLRSTRTMDPTYRWWRPGHEKRVGRCHEGRRQCHVQL